MRANATISRLQALAAERGRPELNEGAAREIVRQGVDRLGGEMWPTWREERCIGLGRGRVVRRYEDNIWIPEDTLRG